MSDIETNLSDTEDRSTLEVDVEDFEAIGVLYQGLLRRARKKGQKTVALKIINMIKTNNEGIAEIVKGEGAEDEAEMEPVRSAPPARANGRSRDTNDTFPN